MLIACLIVSVGNSTWTIRSHTAIGVFLETCLSTESKPFTLRVLVVIVVVIVLVAVVVAEAAADSTAAFSSQLMHEM